MSQNDDRERLLKALGRHTRNKELGVSSRPGKDCLDDNALEAFCGTGLDAEARAAARRHMADCPRCVRVVATMAAQTRPLKATRRDAVLAFALQERGKGHEAADSRASEGRPSADLIPRVAPPATPRIAPAVAQSATPVDGPAVAPAVTPVDGPAITPAVAPRAPFAPAVAPAARAPWRGALDWLLTPKVLAPAGVLLLVAVLLPQIFDRDEGPEVQTAALPVFALSLSGGQQSLQGDTADSSNATPRFAPDSLVRAVLSLEESPEGEVSPGVPNALGPTNVLVLAQRADGTVQKWTPSENGRVVVGPEGILVEADAPSLFGETSGDVGVWVVIGWDTRLPKPETLTGPAPAVKQRLEEGMAEGNWWFGAQAANFQTRSP